MKISRIDVIGANGNDGLHYEGVGAEWLAQSGLIAASGAEEDRGGQDRLPDQVELPGVEGSGEAAAGKRATGGCARGCAGCGCGGTEGEGR